MSNVAAWLTSHLVPVCGVHHVQLSEKIRSEQFQSGCFSHHKLISHLTDVEKCSHQTSHQTLSLSPQQQVDEHSDGEEGAPDGGVAAQEEEEVAEKAEEDHPDHMELKEQVEGVETSRHRSQVFHERGEA